MVRSVGIDLGTTNSVVSVLEGGKPTVIANAEGSRTTPSVVAFAKNGEILVGEVAKRQAVANVERTVRSVKRQMGTDWKMKVDAREFIPQQISAFILQKLKRDAEFYLGEAVTDAVITVPAYFDEAQRRRRGTRGGSKRCSGSARAAASRQPVPTGVRPVGRVAFSPATRPNAAIGYSAIVGTQQAGPPVSASGPAAARLAAPDIPIPGLIEGTVRALDPPARDIMAIMFCLRPGTARMPLAERREHAAGETIGRTGDVRLRKAPRAGVRHRTGCCALPGAHSGWIAEAGPLPQRERPRFRSGPGWRTKPGCALPAGRQHHCRVRAHACWLLSAV